MLVETCHNEHWKNVHTNSVLAKTWPRQILLVLIRYNIFYSSFVFQFFARSLNCPRKKSFTFLEISSKQTINFLPAEKEIINQQLFKIYKSFDDAFFTSRRRNRLFLDQSSKPKFLIYLKLVITLIEHKHSLFGQ